MVMILKRLRERLIVLAFCAFAIICCCVGTHLVRERETVQTAEETATASETAANYIKWVDFSVPYTALSDAMELDISTYGSARHLSWIDTLSYLACKNGGEWGRYKRSQLDGLVEMLGESMTPDELMSENKYYKFYKKAYFAVLGGILG